jgi:IclR family acetate operon transcriptional repressor
MNADIAVKSATRVLDLLEMLASGAEGVGVSEAARRLGIPKSSTSMLFATLEARGYVIGDEDRRFQLNPLLVHGDGSWVGGSALVLQKHAKPLMQKLASMTGESSFLGVRSADHSCEYIAKVITPNELRCDGDLYSPRQLHSTSVGLAILAFQAEERTERFLQQARLERFTALTPTDARQVRAAIEATRRRGYALVMDTNSPGASGMAAPIFDGSGAVIAGLNISAPSSRFDGMPRKYSAELLRAAACVTRQLGARPPAAARKSP